MVSVQSSSIGQPYTNGPDWPRWFACTSASGLGVGDAGRGNIVGYYGTNVGHVGALSDPSVRLNSYGEHQSFFLAEARGQFHSNLGYRGQPRA